MSTFKEIDKLLAKGTLDMRFAHDRRTAFMRLEVVIAQRFATLRYEIQQQANAMRSEIKGWQCEVET